MHAPEMKDVNDEKNQQYSVTIIIREICIMFTANSK